jgi:hypothetical protein
MIYSRHPALSSADHTAGAIAVPLLFADAPTDRDSAEVERRDRRQTLLPEACQLKEVPGDDDGRSEKNPDSILVASEVHKFSPLQVDECAGYEKVRVGPNLVLVELE